MILEEIKSNLDQDEDEDAENADSSDIANDATDESDDENPEEEDEELDEESDDELPVVNGQLGGGNILNRKRKRLVAHNNKFAKLARYK